jgi:ATP-dependent Clp protease ATP-binding subunit ClpB
MTSNLGSQWIMELHVEQEREMRAMVMEALRNHFRPEFLNRIDETIIFKPLSANQIGHIARIQLESVRKRLAERRIELQVTADAMLRLAEEGYDPIFGARPLKRTIQRMLLDPLALLVLDGQFAEGDTVVVDVSQQTVVDENGEQNPFIFRRVRAGQTTDFNSAVTAY